MRPNLHRCAVPSCQADIPRHLLMCMDHWRLVPAPLRRDVTAAWKALRAGQRDFGHASLAEARAHRQAAEQAVAAVTGKTEEKQARHAAAGDLFEHNKETHGNTTTSRRPQE